MASSICECKHSAGVLVAHMQGRNEVAIVGSGVICAQLSISTRTGTTTAAVRRAVWQRAGIRTSLHEAVMTEAARVSFYTDRLCGTRYNASCQYI